MWKIAYTQSFCSGKQNKFYIDVSKEKYKLDCSEVAKLIDMVSIQMGTISGNLTMERWTALRTTLVPGTRTPK